MSNPASASQTLREQIAAQCPALRLAHNLYREVCRECIFCQAADRLASLEQQVTVVDDLPICGAECEAIADRLEAAEVQVASLEQAQQALRKELEVLQGAKPVPIAREERTATDAPQSAECACSESVYSRACPNEVHRGFAMKRCPRCNSPAPNLHPSVQWEGEVQPCPDPWHGPILRSENAGHNQ